MSVDLESLDQPGGVPEEAGIIFHAANFEDFYYFGVVRTSLPKCQAWKYYYEGGQQKQQLAEADISLAFPMRLRMTRLHDGNFLCYANGTVLPFDDSSYASGFVGLSTNATATFDNVAVHGQNAFWPGSGQEEPLIGDYFNHLNLDGMPFMWGLLGEHPTVTGESAWEVVDGGSGHGKVLRGTVPRSTGYPTEAFRGDRGWINQEGETDYMNYWVETQVKLESTTAGAGVCLRVKHDPAGRGDRFYELHLDAAEQKLRFRRRWWDTQDNRWRWEEPVNWSWGPPPNPTQWHTIAVEAVGNELESYFKCYLDGQFKFRADSNAFRDGIVGLWVESDAALLDNVKVRDLRQ